MRSPADMQIIQIELTNACVHQCSNCTRFCGHHKKPFFMEKKFFEKAVLSMDGYPGLVGVMGGEPTLHPDFEFLITFLNNYFGKREVPLRGRMPITDFSCYIEKEFGPARALRRGLWTSGGRSYYKHFELIQDSFHKQLINDHKHESSHQGILISRKDLGVHGTEWKEIRDACWLQNNWSASINPKGAFFCEIAAALDILFDGPGGWPIEPGWWERKPSEFGEQLNWCELCGIALKGPSSFANDECDDISPSLLAKLQTIRSPRVEKGKYRLYNPKDIVFEKSVFKHYIPPGGKRVELDTLDLYPKRIDVSEFNLGAEGNSVTGIHLGQDILTSLKTIPNPDWLLVKHEKTDMNAQWRETLSKIVFNPGCLYLYFSSSKAELEQIAFSREHSENSQLLFFMFNPLAKSFKSLNFINVASLEDLVKQWQPDKVMHVFNRDLMGSR
jgi:hypothetical protein